MPAPVPSAARAGRTAGGPTRVLLTAGLRGATEPCGCTVDLQDGGIGRLAHVIRDARQGAAHVVTLDAGDLLTARVPIPTGRVAQEQARAEVLLETLGLLSYDGLLPSELDTALPAQSLAVHARKHGVPLLTPIPGPPPGSPRLFDAGAVRLGVIPLLDPALGAAHPAAPEAASEAGEAGEAGIGAPALQRYVDALRAAGATHVLVLGHATRRTARRLLPHLRGVDFWLVGHGGRDNTEVVDVGEARLLEVGPEGRRVGCLDLYVDPARPTRRLVAARTQAADDAPDRLRRRIKHLQRKMAGLPAGALQDRQRSLLAEARAELGALAVAPPPGTPGTFQWRLLPVSPDLPPATDVEGLRVDFNARLREINTAAAAPIAPRPAGANTYIGSKACAECHEEETAQWTTTPHSSALDTLAARGKDYDDECVGCHVVGYREPGGAALGRMGDLAHVGCEACHGPASRHALDPSAVEAPPATVGAEPCLRCHVPAHSPRFDLGAYLPRVLGPGHGQ